MVINKVVMAVVVRVIKMVIKTIQVAIVTVMVASGGSDARDNKSIRAYRDYKPPLRLRITKLYIL